MTTTTAPVDHRNGARRARRDRELIAITQRNNALAHVARALAHIEAITSATSTATTDPVRHELVAAILALTDQQVPA